MSNKVENMRTLLLMLFAAISLSVSAQTITVKGNVKDTSGEPVIGASVVEKVIRPTVRLQIWMATFPSRLMGRKHWLFHT